MPHPIRVEISARTDRGLRRESNQDAYLVFRTGRFLQRVQSSIPEEEIESRHEVAGHIMAVADGMGGAAAGEVASSGALTEAFRLILRSPKWLLSLDDPLTREVEIRSFFERTKGYITGVHDALIRQGAADPKVAGMGTTLTVAYSVGLDLFVAHVGDSRAFLVRDGLVRHITRDHTVAQGLADSGEIPQAEVETHPKRHLLTSVVGGRADSLRGDMHHLPLQAGDALVVCTDGLTRVVKDEEIAEVLRTAPSCDDACDALIALTLERGAPDNVTVIVARYSEAPLT
ncbi:MAG TPA: protein phosphatase 2C domain-containing protein [Candidatus Eisenbacteria bacterium]|nr:protein phosphatase 2C domain-containing protein [Candidatus Eisenbacteria bacterium]